MTGIYRAAPLRVNPRQRTVKAVYNTYIDVIHFRKADTKRLRDREEESAEGYVTEVYVRVRYIRVRYRSVHKGTLQKCT